MIQKILRFIRESLETRLYTVSGVEFDISQNGAIKVRDVNQLIRSAGFQKALHLDSRRQIGDFKP